MIPLKISQMSVPNLNPKSKLLDSSLTRAQPSSLGATQPSRHRLSPSQARARSQPLDLDPTASVRPVPFALGWSKPTQPLDRTQPTKRTSGRAQSGAECFHLWILIGRSRFDVPFGSRERASRCGPLDVDWAIHVRVNVRTTRTRFSLWAVGF